MKSMRLNQTHKIKLICVDESARFLDIKNYELSYTMFSIPSEDDLSVDNTSKGQNKSFLKVNYFIKNVLNNSLMYTLEEIEVIERFFADYDNNFLVLPNLAETTLLEAIHSKINVLAGENTYVDQLSLTDADTGIGYDLVTDEDIKYNLPEQKEWMGNLAFWDKPWWRRYDTLTFDNYGESQAEVDIFNQTPEMHSMTQEILDDIDAEVDSLFNKLDGKTGEVIDLAEAKSTTKWNPKVV